MLSILFVDLLFEFPTLGIHLSNLVFHFVEMLVVQVLNFLVMLSLLVFHFLPLQVKCSDHFGFFVRKFLLQVVQLSGVFLIQLFNEVLVLFVHLLQCALPNLRFFS